MIPKNKLMHYTKIILLCIVFNNIKIVELTNIDTETLTSIIRYSMNEESSSYATVTTTPKGNLICSSSYDQGSTIKYYYGLNPNGRPYFIKDNKETEFSSTNSDKARNEGNLYGIQLSSSSDEKEYIMAIGNNQANVEIYDFTEESISIYSKGGTDFFSSESNSFKYSNLIKLKNGNNIYLLSVILHQNNGSGAYVYNFNLFKFSFSSPDIVNNNPIIKSFKIGSSSLSFTSCFETDNNDIICFCINDLVWLVISSYDYDINDYIKYRKIDDGLYTETIFYKCIHFVGNTGVFAYVNNIGNFCFEFIKYENSDFAYHFSNDELKIIQIDNSIYYYNNIIQKCDLINLEEKKFCFITVSSDNKELHLFIFNNFIDEKIIIRKYIIKTYDKNIFKFGQELRATFYNDYIGLATVGYLNSEINYSYLILFSYPNSTDFIFDITETLKNSENPEINFNEKCNIENNIFGYEQVGIILYEIPSGIKLLTSEDKNNIETNTYFNDNLEIIIEENIDLNSQLRIEYTMVVKDPSYDLFNSYSDVYNCFDNSDTCDEETYYEEKNHIGRTSYCDIIIDSSQISNICDNNCLLCLSSNQECLFCKDSLIKSEENPKICEDKICTMEKLINNECPNEKITINQLEEIKEQLLNEDYNGENTIIETETVIIQLSKLDDQENQDNTHISSVDLGDCEKLLRAANNIPDEEDYIYIKLISRHQILLPHM